eukprot:CAMPEP_0173426994 /NCGR_PEP_ID=MMETSP1357-20121228/6294_1 /TAXON_ID=77926 /ORGANISM="Hemiselmis rufescens, Strain PCC563" /LENGTH=1199 /DNA_ID=CAMNT_0014390737 /DNA_START=105 /DNA_END=3704 /DNA_ORIENTATION=-
MMRPAAAGILRDASRNARVTRKEAKAQTASVVGGSALDGTAPAFRASTRARLSVSSAVAAVLLLTPSSAAFVNSPPSSASAFGLARGEAEARPSLRLNPRQPPPWWRGIAVRAGRLCGGPLGLRSVASANTHISTPSRLSSTSVQEDGGDLLLPRHSKVVTGGLPNGLRYCIMENGKPHKRFYANLEVHVGSVDETESEQGIAHYLEHMVFLGTEKHPTNKDMKKLFTRLGMEFNADANAYTDFRSTVYTFSAPTRGKAERVEVGGGAALFGSQGGMSTAGTAIAEEEEEDAEGEDSSSMVPDDSDNVELVLDLLHQMMFKAKIEQSSVDSERGAILSELRDRNTISTRVAMEYYRVAHGDTRLPSRFPIGKEDLVKNFSAEQVRAFYRRNYKPEACTLYIAGDFDSTQVESTIHSVFGQETGQEGAKSLPSPGPEPVMWDLKGAPITHAFDELGPGSGGKVHVIENEQITDVGVVFSVKEPFTSTRTISELRESLLDTIVGIALELRVRALKLSSAEPMFQGISWSYSATGRESCSSNTLSVNALPKNWKQAVSIATEEVKRLELYGVTQSELDQAKQAMRNSLSHQTQQKDSQTSSSWLMQVMQMVQDQDQLMDSAEKERVCIEAMEKVTVEDINQRAAVLFKMVTEFPDSKVAAGSSAFVSAPTDWDGHEAFSEQALKTVMTEAMQNVQAPEDAIVPDELLPHEEVMKLREDSPPKIVKLERNEEAGLTQGKFENGLMFTHRYNIQRPNEISVRITAVGGRALESKSSSGAAIAGLACWLNGGAGGHSAETISRFMTLHQLRHDASCGTETLTFDIKIATTVEGNLRRALGLTRLLFTDPDFSENALERYKQRNERHYKTIFKSLERSTASRFFTQLMDSKDAWKLKELDPQVVNALTVKDVKELVMQQWSPANMEIAISGDFDAQELESELSAYLGTLPSGKGKQVWEDKMDDYFSMELAKGSVYDDSTTVHDDVCRSYTVMGFPSTNRWGILKSAGLSIDSNDYTMPETLADGSPYDSKMHVNRCLSLASDMMSNILFEEIRTQKGLVYGIRFAFKPYKHAKSGVATISFMPKNETLDESVDAVKAVLKRIATEGFVESDFEGVKGPLITKARESALTNGLWIVLMEDLQSPHNPKDLHSITKVPEHYESIQLEHVNEVVKRCWAHCIDELTVCVGNSGPELTSSLQKDANHNL